MKLFHQTVRYTMAQMAIESMRTEHKHTILEVGAGSHGNLSAFLPHDTITFLDTVLTEEAQQDPRFVVGDATRLSYPDNSFDFVIALDVLEHVAIGNREVFLENICRVAKKGVFISFPHYSKQDSVEDESLKTFYRACGGDLPIWIDEHLECTLPDSDEMYKVLKQLVGNDQVYCTFGVRRTLMQKMLCVEAAASVYSEILKFFEVINKQYNETILSYDFEEEKNKATKSYFLICKERKISPVIRNFTCSFKPDSSILDQFEAYLTDTFNWFFHLQELKKMNICHQQSTALFEQQNQFLTAAWQQTLHNFEVIHGNHQKLISKYETTSKENLEMQKSIVHGVEMANYKLSKLCDNSAVLNVVLITYNQSQYIQETLASILKQKTQFVFNIIVADDCSTDNTVDLIKKCQEDTNIEFIYLHNEHNLGIMHNYQRAFAACDGEYVAIMEGDDIWTDPLRLQKHVDFLREHSECAMTFNRYIVKDFESGEFHLQPRFSVEDEKKAYTYISGHNLAYDNLIGNFSTCVYRNSSLKTLPYQLFDMKVYDWLTNILVSKMGYIGCLMQATSIYRIHSKGVWSGQNATERIKGLIESIKEYDQYTNFEFTEGFQAYRSRLQIQLNEICAKEKMEQLVPQNIYSLRIKQKIKSVLHGARRVASYLPPIFTVILKLIIPKALLEKIYEKV